MDYGVVAEEMNTKNICVRDAGLNDLETIVKFNQGLAGESERKSLDHEAVTLGVQNALNDPNKCRYFVAEIDSAVVGQIMITLEWSDWRNGYFWWIQSVYVDPAYRRRGVFRTLYQHVRELARKDSDVCGLRLYVYQENERAIQTYKKLGMTLTDYLLCEEDWSHRH